MKRIRSGEIPNPMADASELKAKGIDAPWADDALRLKKQSGSGMVRSFGPAAALTGKIKTLTILVAFPDQPAKTPAAYFDSVLYSANGATLNNYYKEISYNKTEIIAEDLPSKIGWVMAPHPYTYYVGTGKGEGAYPQNSQGLVEDIVKQIDSQVDFSKYDNNGDGVLEALFIVHTGPGAEFTGNSSTEIWSHAWSTRNTPILDGIEIRRYSIEPEYMKKPSDMTCGVFAHELGHAAFGLPDLYDVDNSSEGLGDWSLMAGGSWNGNNGDSPAHPDAWARIQMGFGKATDIKSNTYGLKLPTMKDTAVIYRVWKDGVFGSEYFLIENRERVGYDSGLPGQGLLIFHVDESVGGSNRDEWYPGHTSTGHYRVALEQADGLFSLEKSSTSGGNRGDGGDCFPGTANNRNFAANSLPNSMDYLSNNNYLAIRNISDPKSIMTVDIDYTDYINLNKSAMDFGVKEVTTKSDTLTFTIKNVGPAATGIRKITNKNPQFKLIPPTTLPQNISAGGSYIVKLQYQPLSAGVSTDSVLVYSTDTLKTPFVVALSGRGYTITEVNKAAMYGCLASSGKGSIISINPVTGASVEIGSPGYSELKALTISRTKNELLGLYVLGGASKILRINAPLGDAYEYLTTDSALIGIAVDNSDRLYGASQTGSIYLVNKTNGHCSLVANTGLAIQSISINPKNNFIYAGVGLSSDDVKDKIYKINKDNGDTLFIGRTGFNVLTNGITFDANGNCFGSKGTTLSAGQLFKIDTANGTATLVGSMTHKGIKGIAMYPGTAISAIGDGLQNASIRTFALEQNYPNPFNPTTSIRYSVPEDAHVTLKVYDILGKELATLVDEVKSAGSHTVNFSISNGGVQHSSGIYFYRLQSGSFSDIKKMVILK
ncbi:MAG: M6 family metalloprotease domain-containing protein [Bacillota bacterium]